MMEADLLRGFTLDVDEVDEVGRRATVRVVPYGVPTEVADGVDHDGRGLSRRPYREGWRFQAFRHAAKAPNRVAFIVGRHEDRRDPFRDIGRMRDLAEREDALYGEFVLDRSTFGDHALAKITSGQWTGISVGAIGLKWEDEGDPYRGGTRWRTLASLDHVLLTESPAYAEAGVLAVRATIETPRLAYWQKRYPGAMVTA